MTEKYADVSWNAKNTSHERKKEKDKLDLKKILNCSFKKKVKKINTLKRYI